MLARRYAVNLCIFATWGLIYGIFCRSIALNINSMAAITGAGSFAGAFLGASAEVLLSAASILFSVCILLIPMLAKRIVEGDIGSTMLLVMGGLQSLVNTAVALAGGAWLAHSEEFIMPDLWPEPPGCRRWWWRRQRQQWRAERARVGTRVAAAAHRQDRRPAAATIRATLTTR